MTPRLTSDAHKRICEIPTVPIYFLAKPQPRERAWDNQRGEDPVELDSSPTSRNDLGLPASGAKTCSGGEPFGEIELSKHRIGVAESDFCCWDCGAKARAAGVVCCRRCRYLFETAMASSRLGLALPLRSTRLEGGH